MEQYITVKREDGVEVTNPQERNLILLRYAAFLNNENNGEAAINIIQHHHPQQQIQQQVPIQIIEQPQQTRKSTKNNVQNAQGANMQATKVGG